MTKKIKPNKEQKIAIEHNHGPILIVAGAGTGKTAVITGRIGRLINKKMAKPEEILALTFTEKAASEMIERVDEYLPLGYTDLWISTFHGFGERVINEYGLDIGLPTSPRLLNEFEQWALIRKNLSSFNLEYYRPLGNPSKFIHALLKHFSRLKDEDITPEEYLAYAEELMQNLDVALGGDKNKGKNRLAKVLALTDLTDGDEEMAIVEVKRIAEAANAYHTYQQLLLENNALDFGDLINYCLRLFRKRPQILSLYRRRFKYILLDEFQDTNWAQYELIKLLSAPKNNIMVVGDDDQSIYKFRGASISNIMQFKKDFKETKEVMLINNYRNRQNILDLAYDFIQQNNPNRLEFQLKTEKHNKTTLSKKLIAKQKGKGKIDVLTADDFFGETQAIIKKIKELKKKNPDVTWDDFAILVRANEIAKEICQSLEAAHLPYLYFASRGLYLKDVILDILAYFRLLDNYHESQALYRVLSIPIFKFTNKEIVDFNYIAKKKSWSLFRVLNSLSGRLGSDVQLKVDKLLSLIKKHTAAANKKTVLEMLIAFLSDSGYLKYITTLNDFKKNEYLNYLNQFKKRIEQFEINNPEKKLKFFLQELQYEIDAGEEGELPPPSDAGPEAIRVMTVHTAKGLEFRFVFVAGMVDQRFPSTKRREAIPVPTKIVKEKLPEGDIHLEEERRLLYVAITRAKEELYFSWAPDYGGKRKKKPSIFLFELGLLKKQEKKQEIRKERDDKFIFTPTKKYGLTPTFVLRLPSYFSHTQLTAYKNCPYQYKLAHLEKVPSQSKYSFSFGQTMHSTLQEIFKIVKERSGYNQDNLFNQKRKTTQENSANINWQEILEIYEEKWIDEWYEDEKQKMEYKKKGKESLRVFYEKFKDNWPHTIKLEEGVNLKIQGYRLYGKIDRIDDLGEEGLQIVDYKTGQPKKQNKLTLEDKEQLLLYQLAVEQAIKKKIANLQFYYLDDNSEVNFLGTDKDKRDMEQKILTRIHGIEKAIKNNNFPPKPGILCKYCDFSFICAYRKII